MSVLHSLKTPINYIDFTVTFTASLIHLSCYILLFYKPKKASIIAAFALFFGGFILLLPTWYYVYKAWGDPSILLSETLPPLSAIPAITTVAAYVFLSSQRALKVSLTLWAFFGIPVFSYFIAHSEQLMFVRGQDIFVTGFVAPLIIFALMQIKNTLHHEMMRLNKEKSALQYKAETDGLTGAYNRHYAESMIGHYQSIEVASVNCLMFDVDHFKHINDTYGHESGDIVLKQITQACQSLLRADDHLIRWGGEEFLVFLENTSLKDATRVAEKLRNAIEGLKIPSLGEDDPLIAVTASFGLCFCDNSTQVKKGINRSDKALLRAKANGRNRVEIYTK